MAKFAAKPEIPIDRDIDLANRAKLRVQDVDVAHVVMLRDLPVLPTGTTSQVTGEDAEYTWRKDNIDALEVLAGNVPDTLACPPPDIPEGFINIENIFVEGIAGGKLANNGGLNLTIRTTPESSEAALRMFKNRRPGFLLYMCVYGVPPLTMPEGWSLDA